MLEIHRRELFILQVYRESAQSLNEGKWQARAISAMPVYSPEWFGASTRAILAPMAGKSDHGFRKICYSKGCDFAVTELMNSDGLKGRIPRTMRLLYGLETEHPVAVQIFGRNIDSYREAVRVAEGEGADVIDVNMGCPAKKVVKGGYGSGSAMMRDPERAREVLEIVRNSTSLPVSVKMRSGWDANSINAAQIAAFAQELGYAAVTIHPRTREQSFKGFADWDVIRQVREACPGLPVIGNGDIKSPQDALRMLRQTGCHAIMIGRATYGNPWMFGRVRAVLDGLPDPGDPDLAEVISTIIEHLSLQVEEKGERVGLLQMRKHYVWYLSSFPQSGNLLKELKQLENIKEVMYQLIRFQEVLSDN
jgi:tRNA-dihydrouridine synthase B